MSHRATHAFRSVLSLVAAAMLALCGGAGAGPEPGESAYGDQILVEVPPEPIERPQPAYTAEMARRGLEGTVVLMALVGEEGRVRDTRVLASIPGLDSAAVEAVRRWTFEPALSNGLPVAFWVQAQVRFPPRHPRSGSTDPDTSRAPRSLSPARREILEAVDAQARELAVWKARLAAAADSAWTRSPATIAIEFAGGGYCECARFAFEVRSTPERFDIATVIVTYDGLLDDSMRSAMLELSLQRHDGRWRIERAQRRWRCWPGRGHETYGMTRCQ